MATSFQLKITKKNAKRLRKKKKERKKERKSQKVQGGFIWQESKRIYSQPVSTYLR